MKRPHELLNSQNNGINDIGVKCFPETHPQGLQGQEVHSPSLLPKVINGTHQ